MNEMDKEAMMEGDGQSLSFCESDWLKPLRCLNKAHHSPMHVYKVVLFIFYS